MCAFVYYDRTELNQTDISNPFEQKAPEPELHFHSSFVIVRRYILYYYIFACMDVCECAFVFKCVCSNNSRNECGFNIFSFSHFQSSQRNYDYFNNSIPFAIENNKINDEWNTSSNTNVNQFIYAIQYRWLYCLRLNRERWWNNEFRQCMLFQSQ